MRFLAVAVVLLSPYSVSAQSIDVGVVLPSAQWSEFDDVEFGVGGRVSWRMLPVMGVEAELNWYPSDYPTDTAAFSATRYEGLFGVTAGPQLSRARPFVRFAGGFLRSSEAPEPLACIAIFPPPLACLMASGHTLPAVDFGGGVQFDATTRTFVRFDVSSRWLRYPGPAFDSDRAVRNENFWGAGVRFAFGGGVRF